MEVSYSSHKVKIKRNISTIVNQKEDGLAGNLRKLYFKQQTYAMIATKLKVKYPRYNTIDNKVQIISVSIITVS